MKPSTYEFKNILNNTLKNEGVEYKFHNHTGITNLTIEYKGKTYHVEFKAYPKRRDFSDTGFNFDELGTYFNTNALIIFYDYETEEIYGNFINELIKTKKADNRTYPWVLNTKTGKKVLFPVPKAFTLLSNRETKGSLGTNLLLLLTTQRDITSTDRENLEKIVNKSIDADAKYYKNEYMKDILTDEEIDSQLGD